MHSLHQNNLIRIALVIDRADWAFGHIAARIKFELCELFEIAIFETQHIKPIELLRRIFKYKPDIVHFFWRKDFNDIITKISDNARYIRYRHDVEHCHITFSIPDHLYIDINDIIMFSPMFHQCSGYVVTSDKLWNIYTRQNLVPFPTAKIRDFCMRSGRAARSRTEDDPVKFVWVGNSAWGEWIGYDDYKGVREIVTPVFAALKGKYGEAVECALIDSAEAKLSREETLNVLANSDVLLCASIAEGTPLPLLEAMETACAIITTDVGIAQEVLPPVQSTLIVERDGEAFLHAAERLLENRKWLMDIQQANLAAFNKLDSEGVGPAWKAFFESIINTKKQHHLKRVRFNLNTQYSPFSERLSRAIRSKPIINIASRITNYDRRSRYRRALATMELKIAEGALKRMKVDQDGTLFIANPRWPGVFTSTRHLSDGNLLPYPIHTWREPNTVLDEELHGVADLITSCGIGQVVLSGGDRYQRKLAECIAERKPDTKIGLMWHGQVSQWIAPYEREVFQEWLLMLKSGFIDKIGVFKESLDSVLRARGFNSFRLSNYLPSWPSGSKISDACGNKLRIGLWSATCDWRKNIHTQLLSLTLLDRKVVVHHSFDAPDIVFVMEQFGVPGQRCGAGLLRHDRLHREMSKTDLTLYVTLGECSPMTPLESLSMFSPAIVGPVSDIYDCDEVLRSALVVTKPDTPTSIAEAIARACSSRSEILSKRDQFLAMTKFLGQKRLNLFLSA
jgi:hypothetical protein